MGDLIAVDSGTHRLARVAQVAMIAALVSTAAACGGSSDGSDSALSAAGSRGRDVANSNGCASCHGSDGQGGVGPTWVGLYGSERALDDGTTVTADDAYLIRAIADPGSDKVAGATVVMPSNGLSDAEIDDVIAYIRDLSTAAAASQP